MRFNARLLGSLLLLLPLASCILTPGKFVSTMDITHDRSFTFIYVGEVIASEPSSLGMDEKAGEEKAADDKSGDGDKPAAPKPESAEDKQKMAALAETLSKEHGYRSVRYLGHHHFAIDYRVTGKLTHNFLYPFNIDGEVIVPFLAVELRGADRLRLKAPGFANDDNKGGDMAGLGSSLGSAGGSPGKAASELDGTFTLTTDAEITSQNQENGVTTLQDGRKRIVWRATPQTKDAPTASLKLDALP